MRNDKASTNSVALAMFPVPNPCKPGALNDSKAVPLIIEELTFVHKASWVCLDSKTVWEIVVKLAVVYYSIFEAEDTDSVSLVVFELAAVIAPRVRLAISNFTSQKHAFGRNDILRSNTPRPFFFPATVENELPYFGLV